MEKQRKVQLIHYILKRIDRVEIGHRSRKSLTLKVDRCYIIHFKALQNNCIFCQSCNGKKGNGWPGYLNWLNQKVSYHTNQKLW